MNNRKLRSLRSYFDINQSELAKLINVTLNTYSAKERGVTFFNQIEMIKITIFFKEYNPKLTMDDIFFKHEVTETVTEVSKSNKSVG